MKKIIVVLIFLFGFLFINTEFISAQTSNNKTGWRAVCLNRIWCYDNAKENPDYSQIGICTKKLGHRVRLSSRESDKSLKNSPTYIIECFSYVPAGATTPILICTTGSSVLDKELFCPNQNSNDPSCNQYDNYSKLNKDIGYNLSHNDEYGIFKIDGNQATKIPPQKLMSDSIGNIPFLEWQSYTPAGHFRKFLAVNTFNIVDNPNAQGGGQKQSTLFDASAMAKDCAVIGWDPEGTVFDAVSLEPVPNSSVTLLKKYSNEFRDARESEIGLANPQVTIEDGKFSFIVADGTYKLTALAVNYTFPIDLVSRLNQNYTNIYSNIYPIQSGIEIIQKGKLEHRDIPMLPNNSTGYKYNLKALSFFNDLDKSTGQIVIEGRVSHPLTRIKVYTLKNTNGILTKNRNVFTGAADKLGRFNIRVNQSILESGEVYGNVEFEKVDLTNNQPTNQTTSIKFDSIPNYLDGFAYDTSGKPLTNTKVAIYTTYSDKPYFETTTDDTGHFKITSEYLPFMPYKIKYLTNTNQTSKIQSIEVNPNQFIAQNSQYLLENNISLSSYRNSTDAANVSKPPVAKPTKDGFASQPIGTSISKIPGQGDGTVQSSASSSVILILAIILLLIGGAGAMLGIYALHKKQQPPIV